MPDRDVLERIAGGGALSREEIMQRIADAKPPLLRDLVDVDQKLGRAGSRAGGWMRARMFSQTRAGGATSGVARANGSSRASQPSTARRSAGSERSRRRKRPRAGPCSVPSTYSAASLSRSSGF